MEEIGVGDGSGGFAGWSDGDEKTREAFVESEDSLSVGSKEHEIGFPVTGDLSEPGIEGTFSQWTSELDEGSGRAALAASESSFGLGSWEVVSPGVVLVTSDLSVDESVDSLVRDDTVSVVCGEPSSDLLR